MINFEEINREALHVLPDLLPGLLPGGKFRGPEYICSNFSGGQGDSFSINTNTGKWSDFATGDKGGDPVSLVAAVKGVKQGEAALLLAGMTGTTTEAPKRHTTPRTTTETTWTTYPAVSEPQEIRHPSLGTPDATWAYRDPAGHILGYACRFDQPDGKKQVVPYTHGRDESGRSSWRWKSFSEPRPLYGHDRLTQWPDAPVLIVEGEKAADAAQRLLPDVVCITWPGGGKAVQKADWTSLQGRRVAIWPDNDQPGLEAGTAVATKCLEAGAAEVSISNPPAGKSKGWDAADAEAEGWTAEHTLQWLSECTQRPSMQASYPSSGSWLKKAIEDASSARFLNFDPPVLDWIFKNSFMARTVGLFCGPGGAGKSTFLLLLAITCALCLDILKGVFEPTRPGKVLLIFAEEDEAILHHRFKNMIDFLFPFSPEYHEMLKENLLLIPAAGHDLRLLSSIKNDVGETDFFHELLKAVGDIPDLRMIVVDPLVRFYGSAENDNTVGTYFVTLLEKIAQATGAGVIAAHHVKKNAAYPGGKFDLSSAMSQDVARGASGLTDAVRWQCNLFSLPADVAKKELGIRGNKTDEYLALRVCKKNYGPPEEIHFLKRWSGGYMLPFESQTKIIDAEISEVITGMVTDTLKELCKAGRSVTAKMIVDGCLATFKEKDARVTRVGIQQVITAGLMEERFFEVPGRNASGRQVSWLTLDPSATDLEAAREPAALKPAEPATTGQDSPPVQ